MIIYALVVFSEQWVILTMWSHQICIECQTQGEHLHIFQRHTSVVLFASFPVKILRFLFKKKIVSTIELTASCLNLWDMAMKWSLEHPKIWTGLKASNVLQCFVIKHSSKLDVLLSDTKHLLLPSSICSLSCIQSVLILEKL